MNDRNAFLQGQGSPIKDDEPPPVQGWRGERAATDSASDSAQQRNIPGTDAQAQEISGTAFAESSGLGSPNDPGEEPSPPRDGRIPAMQADSSPQAHSSSQTDGVSDLSLGRDSTGGQSAGAAYPNPYGTSDAKSNRTTPMGHGGQTEIAYHGPGHLGEQDVDDGNNRNGVAESNE